MQGSGDKTRKRKKLKHAVKFGQAKQQEDRMIYQKLLNKNKKTVAKDHSASSWVRLKGGSFANQNVAANYASDGGLDASP